MLHSCVFQTAEIDTDSPEHQLLHNTVKKRYALNKHVFANLSSELADYLNEIKQKQFSIFVNKANQLNIADLSTGSALYGDEPEAECDTEFYSFLSKAPYFSLNDTAGIETNLQRADVLLVFGLGLGFTLQKLIENLKVKFLILYEPRADFLNCSAHAIDWQNLLHIADRNGIHLGLQIGNAGSDLAEHLSEILTMQPNINRVHYYRHLSHPVSDEIIEYYKSNSGNSSKLLNSNRQFLGYEQSIDYVPLRTGNMLGNITPLKYSGKDGLFSVNLHALEKYFPHLAHAMRSYQAQRWQLVLDENHATNLYNFKRDCFLYRRFNTEIENISNLFFKSNFKGYKQVKPKVPYKLRHYIHYKALAKLDAIESKFSNFSSTNIENISSLIISGCCLSLPLDTLFEKANLKNIFLFESEPDFFYASLFVLPWHVFLKQMDEHGRQLYLNVGGSSGDYFDEILRQFYRVGPYALAESCFWLNYVSPALQKTFVGLQEQLRSILALGDYFDHAKYGIHHSLSNLDSKSCVFMLKKHLIEPLASLPIFIVGNGPSLDYTAKYIKKYQKQAIVISVGTAIKPLLSYDIVPDFHVEAEQNASTFDHLKSSCGESVLKEIALISFSSVHPETRALFKNGLLAFKEGEAPTVVFKDEIENALKQSLRVISYALPTASNLALSFVLGLGHKQVYLFGVDFGQVDPNYHHSKKSIYYNEAGTQSYEYTKANPEQIVVAGNFRKMVFTKPEFDLARKVAEMLLKDFQKHSQVYNCSDGALIQGTMPLQPDHILLPSTVINKQAYLDILQSEFFIDTSSQTFFNARYINGILTKSEKVSVLAWTEKLIFKGNSIADAKSFITLQWQFFESDITKTKMIFCLYYSSVTYFFSRFTALLSLANNGLSESETLHNFESALDVFITFLTESCESIKKGEREYCSAELAFLNSAL
ncbi:DUF115 domain-containing protein [Rheinheimera sp. UJ51]|uniref:motility associated factor glycosyltransferase family protein n=1 Tax=Rheinheimera sp. UJ51 TaxID=2892446 RepID=UPI001E5DD52E|nr:6-hydroxymethylpterin diphosphokinase MptE-like protein [Rheinheimera sp. UJ51]MCC5450497.1 DUF115 domain-containing protein [Rheinheimera sp. UJ51]